VNASELVLVEDALRYIQESKKGKRTFPTDYQVANWLEKKYGCGWRRAAAILASAKHHIALQTTALLPTLGANVIHELGEVIQEARRSGDMSTAVRGLAHLGKFAGLDQPQMSPEQQVKQLSDAALEAALEATIARKLETMSDDQFGDMVRRREERRLAGAKQATPPKMIDAGSDEAAS
jgi:ribosomal protein S13